MDASQLALLPTPIHRLPRLSAALGAEIWVKRDDLTGAALSGNKVRKLRRLFAEAQALGADTVLTTGGIGSNHARATAIAARTLGLRPILLLRGAPPAAPDGNLLLDRLVGAEIHWCTPDEYRHERDARLAALAAGVAAQGGRPYVIPEGGSNAVGSLAYAEAATEVAVQAGGFDHVVVAVGSGGTLAGLALGPDVGRLHGVAVCDDRAYFSAKVHAIAAEAGRELPAEGRRWEVTEGYQGPAYAVATPEIWATIRRVAELEGLVTDPVYTGKALHALVTEVSRGAWGGRVLFWHTGGIFGLFGRGDEVEAACRASG